MRGFAVLVVVVLLLVVGLGVAEAFARRAVDDEVDRQVTEALRANSTDGRGFATVEAGARGWAIPALLRGELEGIDAVAADGEIGGLRIQQVSARTGTVDLTAQSADDVAVEGVLTQDQVVGLAQLFGIAPTSLSVTDTGALRAAGRVEVAGVGTDLEADLLPSGGAEGVAVQVVAVRAGGVALDPAAVFGGPLTLVAAADLPAGFSVAAVEVAPGAGGAGAVVRVRLVCPEACSAATAAG